MSRSRKYNRLWAYDVNMCALSYWLISSRLSGPLLVPLMIFSGFLINFDDVPTYFLFLRYISWFGYANEALQINQWHGVTNITCENTGCIQAFSSGNLILAYLQMNPVRLLFALRFKKCHTLFICHFSLLRPTLPSTCTALWSWFSGGGSSHSLFCKNNFLLVCNFQ